MASELITFKMDSAFLEEVDKTVKDSSFQNRTEFIRAALREKIDEVKMKKAMTLLSKYYGKADRKTTDEERHKASEKVFEEFAKRLK